MPPPLLPDFVIPAALVAWVLISVHVQLIRQKRLVGYSIVTHFIATTSLTCGTFIEFYVPAHWHGGAKWFLVIGCYILMALCMSVTKKSPALAEQRRWRKTKKRGAV